MSDKEDNKKAPSKLGKLGRRIMAPIMSVPAGIAGAALLGSQPDVPIISATKLGARVGYNTIMQDEEALDEAGKEFEADVNRAKSVKRQRNTGKNTNAMGDTYKKGGKVSSASSRGDGIAQRGKTKGQMV